MNTLNLFGSSRGIVVATAGALALAGAAGTAMGQNLANLPGLTEVQKPTAVTVQGVCAEFLKRPQEYKPDLNGTAADKLFYTCRVMVQTANQLAGTGVTANSLGISNDELRTGVQAIAPMQMNAQKQVGVEASKINLMGLRLLDLRGGASGFTVSSNGVTAPASARSGFAAASGLEGESGGAASSDVLGGKLGGFLNVGYNWGDVDQTSLQDAYKYRNFLLLAGLDYRVSDALVLGGAFSYSDTRASFEQSLGKVDATTYGIAGYGTYYVKDWYLDAFVAYGAVDYESVRNINIPSRTAIPPIITSATASPKADQWSASVGVGRNYEYGRYSIAPSARLTYLWVKNQAFSEDEPIYSVGLAVEERTIKSLQSSLGVKASTTINSTAGVFVPYATLQWLHEFENDSPSIISKYVNDPFNTVFVIPTSSPTRDYAVISVGSSAVFKNDLSGFAQFSTALGIENVTSYSLVIGLRKQF